VRLVSPIGGTTGGSGNLSTKVYFSLVGDCARNLRNPGMKCDLPIGYSIPLTNREVAFDFVNGARNRLPGKNIL
jgi:hypothetical protein